MKPKGPNTDKSIPNKVDGSLREISIPEKPVNTINERWQDYTLNELDMVGEDERKWVEYHFSKAFNELMESIC